jgi:hypothetical protein
MNSLVESAGTLHETQKLRVDLMNALTDSDLDYKLPGDNLTLGELCRDMGAAQHIYIQSFKTFKMDWSYRSTEPELATSVERLKAWYKALDEEFDSVIQGLAEDDIHSKQIDRGGFMPSLFIQYHIYREALLIFYAKASIYMRALQKPVSDQWRSWIG